VKENTLFYETHVKENTLYNELGINDIINKQIDFIIDDKDNILSNIPIIEDKIEINNSDNKYILDENQIKYILKHNSLNSDNSNIDLSMVIPISEDTQDTVNLSENSENKEPVYLSNINDFKVNITYKLEDLTNVFNKFNEAILLIQIIDGNIKYIEKKGYESRNQSVIDLLIKANDYKKLPNIQFLIYTNDYIENNLLTKCPYLFTFCKKYSYDTQLFPNFNFNHWLEAGIDNYDIIYDYFINNNIKWENKENLIFWSGSIKTNSIRKKLHKSTIENKLFYINSIDNRRSNTIPIKDINKYKYLLNMNGNTYGGRLNYLFMSGSCVIILKNEDKEKTYDEYFYKYFIPNEDYIEIKYNDNEDGNIIVNRILKEINNANNEEMALRCLEKAKKIFSINNVYEYINKSLSNLSSKSLIESKLETTTIYIPPLNKYFKDRLFVDNNSIQFNYQGSDMDILLYNNELLNDNNIINENNKIRLSILGDSTKVYLNNYLIMDKYTPFILNPRKYQHYLIKIEENKLTLIIENKFKLLNIDIKDNNNNLVNMKYNKADVMSNYGSWILL
jgi:hypothetical protein